MSLCPSICWLQDKLRLWRGTDKASLSVAPSDNVIR